MIDREQINIDRKKIAKGLCEHGLCGKQYLICTPKGCDACHLFLEYLHRANYVLAEIEKAERKVNQKGFDDCKKQLDLIKE